MNLYRSLLLSVIVLGAIACGNEKKKDEKEIGKSESQSPLITVDTLVLKKRTFQKQIVCNGKLRAVFKSDLSFDGTGVITAINGSNGGYVKKGEVLATLDMKEAQVELEKVTGRWKGEYRFTGQVNRARIFGRHDRDSDGNPAECEDFVRL